ncbi:unnamed protein product [Triticum turgidum subsp. durum]|uniref:AB hydrolase-1 domain-containing protein n=1 Tax=Triticum turgidum subsp. durum TaxID=4567 RepID=A0A9R1RS31_TRITD|nr:unnamed protein product [Triticum turgidum subsp. durum]
MSPSSVPAAAVATSTRLILVHGTGHGGWCWYKVATLLRAAGHRVDAPDLAACGADARRLSDLPDGERAVLVGHSFGGMSIALAAEEFPDKVAAAVFLTAFMPDCDAPRTRVIEEVPVSDWMDSVVDEEHAPPSVFLGPEFVRRKLYQLTSEEDYTLCQSLARVSSYYVADQQQRPPFSAARYGAVTKVYVIAKQDQAMVEEYQRQMIAGIPVAEVREMADADHMVMLSAPEELAGHLADIANNYT